MKVLYISFFCLVSLISNALTVNEARHLLARTGFGGTPQEIEALKNMTRSQSVHLIINSTSKIVVTVPDWASSSIYRPAITGRELRTLPMEERQKKQKEIRMIHRKHGQSLKGWWIRQMIMTTTPFQEHMILFWQNHFTSSLRKVNIPYFIYQQHQTIRKNALGNFGNLVKKICKDPAMIIYLDTRNSVKSHPNENFARELMELFTLGEGNYTEEDIKELARCFTGWKLNPDDGTFRFVERQHDDRRKKILGERDDFEDLEVIDLLLRQDALAIYVVEKLWSEFISPYPDKKEVERLASGFRKDNYEIKELMYAIFLSDFFWEQRSRGQLIKSPIELLVGTARLIKLEIPTSAMMIKMSTQLGQDLFNPPNVKGWPNGQDSISAASLLLRQKFIKNCNLLIENSKQSLKIQRKGRDRYTNDADAVAFESPAFGLNQWIEAQKDTPQNRQMIEQIVLALPALSEKKEQETVNELIERLMLDPVYQLK